MYGRGGKKRFLGTCDVETGDRRTVAPLWARFVRKRKKPQSCQVLKNVLVRSTRGDAPTAASLAATELP